jgi:hypothetical protein
MTIRVTTRTHKSKSFSMSAMTIADLHRLCELFGEEPSKVVTRLITERHAREFTGSVKHEGETHQ